MKHQSGTLEGHRSALGSEQSSKKEQHWHVPVCVHVCWVEVGKKAVCVGGSLRTKVTLGNSRVQFEWSTVHTWGTWENMRLD